MIQYLYPNDLNAIKGYPTSEIVIDHLISQFWCTTNAVGKDFLDALSPEMLVTCKRLLAQFDSVSVREVSAVELCKNYFDCEATHVLDPTLLLDQNDYESLIDNKDCPSEEYVLSYILDESEGKRQMIKKFANKNSLPVRDVFADSKIAPSISDWIYAIKHAKYVITDSFHGMVFSIIFRKQFAVTINEARGATRFTSLLKLLDLKDRVIEDGGNPVKVLKTPLDVMDLTSKLDNKKLDIYQNLQQAFMP